MTTITRISGSSVLGELQSALEDVRDRAATLRNEWQRFEGQMDEFVDQRGAAVLELAQHYLPDLSRESIAAALSGIQDDIRAVLERKERRIVELHGQYERLTAERQQSQQELADVTEQLNEKVRQREQLEQTVAAALAENPQFQTLSQQALAAEAELGRNEERVTEITHEAAEKLPAYESSQLFQYLYKRGFGTADYQHRGLTRRLDRWVARLVDYYPARKSYEFLTRTPELMRQEVERRRKEFNDLMARVEELEQFAADETGLTQVLQEGDRLGAQRDALVAKVDGQKEQCRQIEEELLKLQQSHGQFYEEALDRFRAFLSRTETAVLEHHARTTPERTDDEIVGRISWLNGEIDRLEPDVVLLSREFETLQQQSEGLDYVVRRYQHSNFDSERSYFDGGFDIDEYLDRFRKNVTSKDDVWQSIRRRQQFEPTWVEKSSVGVEEVVNSPLAHVLMHAMVEAAGAAMSGAARRSVRRRSPIGRGGVGLPIDIPMPNWPSSTPSVPSSPPTRNRGFTRGEGF